MNAAEKRRRAQKAAMALGNEKQKLNPIRVEGRTIARSYEGLGKWAKAETQWRALQASVPTMLVLEPLVAVLLGVVVLGEALKLDDPRTVGLLAIAVVAMGAATIALGHDEGAFEEMLEAQMAKRNEPSG